MLEKKQNTVALKSHVKKETKKSPSLMELVREDAEISDFFRFVRDEDMRKEAFEALKRKINGSLH